MAKRICIYGGTFDPAGLHHRQIAIELAKLYDLVVVVPCGPRFDKLTVNDRSPIHRAISVHWTFLGLERIEVDYSDLERDRFTRTHELVERYQAKYPDAEIYIYVGSDNFERDSGGVSKIGRVWAQAEQMLAQNHFTIHIRDGYPIHQDDWPRHYQVVEINVPGSSSQIRDAMYQRQPYEHMVMPEVAEHMRLFDVYGSRAVSVHSAEHQLFEPRPRFVVDQGNPRSQSIFERLQHLVDPSRWSDNGFNCICPVAGDGGVLPTFRDQWQARLPFICFNAGTVGYMLNDVPDEVEQGFLRQYFQLYHFPLLLVRYQTLNGETGEFYAVNEAELIVPRGQARLAVYINGEQMMSEVPGSGILVCGTLGSSGANSSCGGPLLRLESQDLVITGDRIPREFPWKHSQISGDDTVRVVNLFPERRPTRLDSDERPAIENVVEMTIRQSRLASIMIGSFPGIGLEHKRLRHQFPLM